MRLDRAAMRMRAAAGAAALLAATSLAMAADLPPRHMPPAQAGCPRDRLTSYDGRVLHYTRTTGRTQLQIRTDWDTTETVRLRHPGSDDPSAWFLLNGQPFQPGDWARIETRRGQLQSGLRVVAWVCDDGRPPLVDWQPPAR